jgi:DNA polymerase-3 subunit delta
MIYFIFGEDSYRSKRKLEEIISGYREVHKSGLNLVYIDTKGPKGCPDFKDFYSNFKINSMFAEKKLIILKSTFGDLKFQEEFLENIKNLEDIKDIVIVYEDNAADKRTKFFKALQKHAKCQEFNSLQPALLKKWVAIEFDKNKIKINTDAIDLLCSFVKNDLWRMEKEINKLSNYKMADAVVNKEDVELLVKPDVDNDIFKTIDALASKDKKQALFLLHKHLENGDAPLYLLSMISYQFRNLLILKELQESQQPYAQIVKKSGLHPFVAQKTYYLCNQFSMDKLKKIYHKIFQVDSDIKTGKIDPELSLDLLLSEI